MDDQLIGIGVLLFTRLFDQSFCQGGKFVLGDNPAHNVTIEDVHDQIRVKVILEPAVRDAMFFGHQP